MQRGYPEAQFEEVPCHHPLFLQDARPSDELFGAGFVLRPKFTPIECGKAGDSGGHCRFSWCTSPAPTEVVTPESASAYHKNKEKSNDPPGTRILNSCTLGACLSSIAQQR